MDINIKYYLINKNLITGINYDNNNKVLIYLNDYQNYKRDKLVNILNNYKVSIYHVNDVIEDFLL